MVMQNFLSNPAFTRGLLDEDPRFAFNTFLGQGGFNQGQQRFLRSRYGDIENLFNQQLGQSLLQGNLPTTSFFNDFLPNFNLNQFMGQFAPATRGLGIGQFSPRTNFLYR